MKFTLSDRSAWLREQRRLSEEKTERLYAAFSDLQPAEMLSDLQKDFLQRFIAHLQPPRRVLDAACGAGRAWNVLLESGCQVTGIDQSAAVVAHAVALHPRVVAARLSLQEIAWEDAFDGSLCIDAMENIFPEDWVRVLSNFYAALQPGGVFYLTLPAADPAALEDAYRRAVALDWPVLPGELLDEEGYRYFPALPRVRDWLLAAGFVTLAEETDGFTWHWLVQKPGP